MNLSHHLLTLVTFSPLLGVLVLLFLKKEQKTLQRWVALITSLVTFAISIAVLAEFDASNPDLQLVIDAPWSPSNHWSPSNGGATAGTGRDARGCAGDGPCTLRPSITRDLPLFPRLEAALGLDEPTSGPPQPLGQVTRRRTHDLHPVVQRDHAGASAGALSFEPIGLPQRPALLWASRQGLCGALRSPR